MQRKWLHSTRVRPGNLFLRSLRFIANEDEGDQLFLVHSVEHLKTARIPLIIFICLSSVKQSQVSQQLVYKLNSCLLKTENKFLIKRELKVLELFVEDGWEGVPHLLIKGLIMGL